MLPSVTMRSGLRRAAGNLLPGSVLVRQVPNRERLVSLTFDDGPDDDTLELLDLLDVLQLSATFFVLGESAARHPDLVREIIARGHEVASHGHSHRRVTRMSLVELAADLERSRATLPPMPGPRLFRPPHGDISAVTLSAISMLGYTTVLWSIDSLDSRRMSADEIIRGLDHETIRAGDIVLLHEGEKVTREALPRIADRLRARGLRSVPVSTLMATRLRRSWGRERS